MNLFLCYQNMKRNSSAIPDYISALNLPDRTADYLLPFTFLKRNYFHHTPQIFVPFVSNLTWCRDVLESLFKSIKSFYSHLCSNFVEWHCQQNLSLSQKAIAIVAILLGLVVKTTLVIKQHW